MELFSEEVKGFEELKERLKNYKQVPKEYKVAVIVFAFDKENRLILQRRGPECRDERFKLEGIGGGVKATDADFRSALQREIIEEVGSNANIKIEEFITAIGRKTSGYFLLIREFLKMENCKFPNRPKILVMKDIKLERWKKRN